MLKNIPDWKILEKIGDLWVTRVLWGIGYFIFYLVFSPSYWFFLLLPVHFLMGPIHGAIVNWCGQEHVSIEEWCAYFSELTGLEPKFEQTDETLRSVITSNAKMQGIVGPAEVHWKDGLRRMLESQHPDWIER